MRSRSIQLAAGIVAIVLVAGCGKSGDKPIEAAASPPTSDATTTSARPAVLHPLTGVPMDAPDQPPHRALVVKIDNAPDARPQTGINSADIVYELLVEGITRYAVVYHSQMPEVVGPVRSARSSDMELLANLGGPLIAWSGANPGVTGELYSVVDAGLLVNAGQDAFSGEYYRDKSRRAPHNLYTNAASLLGAASPAELAQPAPLFRYRAPFETYPGAEPVPGYVVDFGHGVRAEYVWDGERGGWDRFQVDESHGHENSATVDSDGVQVAPQNVVILFMGYGQSPSDARSPMALSTGGGEAVVLTEGKAVVGSWHRPTALSPWELVDQAGAPILLSPGRTWVALPEIGSTATPLDAETAGGLLAVRR